MIISALKKRLSNLIEPRMVSNGLEKLQYNGDTRGELIYAIGDIHGCIDQLQDLVEKITIDIASTEVGVPVRLIFLGDYIDRGPDSRGVIEDLLAIRNYAGWQATFLKGNHEAALNEFLTDPSKHALWLQEGGAATLRSYGLTDHDLDAPPRRLRDALLAAMPREHLDFIQNLQSLLVVGEFAFAHAGIRPGIMLADQTEDDLLGIGDEFLRAPNNGSGMIIVHGHNRVSTVQFRHQSIAVDTGAWQTGKLSAVRLFGRDRRVFTSLPPQDTATRRESSEANAG